MDFEYNSYGDYTPDNDTDDNSSGTGGLVVTFNSPKAFRMETLVVINSLISLLGLIGNATVIWISGCKMKTTVNTTFYLSLAISDLLFCFCLPFNVFYLATSHWPFGLLMCKLTSSAMFLNMFSSVFLLVLISVDRCVLITFPVWAQNHRTVRKASGVVVLMWALSAALTLPSLVHRESSFSDPLLLFSPHSEDEEAYREVYQTFQGHGGPHYVIFRLLGALSRLSPAGVTRG